MPLTSECAEKWIESLTGCIKAAHILSQIDLASMERIWRDRHPSGEVDAVMEFIRSPE